MRMFVLTGVTGLGPANYFTGAATPLPSQHSAEYIEAVIYVSV